MGTRIPKPFHKALSTKKYKKKVLSRIFSSRERDFIESLMREDSAEGVYRIKEDLDKKELAHLNKLSKEIKKNKGVVTLWKAGILAVFLALLIVFNLLFKDALIGNMVENNLERVFGAQVEMEEPRFSIFGGTFSFHSLQVADKDNPYSNLFELGYTELSVDIFKLFEGKYIVDAAETREILFDTERETSGVLEPRAAGDTDRDSEKDADKSTLAEASGLMQDVGMESAETLFNSYRDQLKSPEYIERTNNRIRDSIDSWDDNIVAAEEQFDIIEENTRDLLSDDPRNFETIEEARSYVTRLTEQKRRVEGFIEHTDTLAGDFRDDLDFVSSLESEIKETIDEDTDFLSQAVGSFGMDAKNAVSTTAEPIIKNAMGKSFEYAQKAFSTAKFIKSRSDKKEAKYAEDSARTGTTINYPTIDYPRFLLRRFFLSFGSEREAGYTEFSISDIAFSPDRWEAPISVNYRSTPEERRMEVDGILDLRSDADAPFTTDVLLEDFPVSLSSGLTSLSIDSLSSSANHKVNLALSSPTEGEGRAYIELDEIEIDFVDSSGPVAGAIREILSDIDSAGFNVHFSFVENTLSSFSVETDLDEQLRSRVGAYLEMASKETADKLEEELYGYIESYLKENKELQKRVQFMEENISQQVREAENLETLLEKQRREARAYIENRLEEARKEAEDEAQRKIDEQKEKLEEEGEKQLDKVKDGLGGLGF